MYFPYTVHTSSTALRRALLTLDGVPGDGATHDFASELA